MSYLSPNTKKPPRFLWRLGPDKLWKLRLRTPIRSQPHPCDGLIKRINAGAYYEHYTVILQRRVGRDYVDVGDINPIHPIVKGLF